MYARKTQFTAQVWAAQYQQQVNKFLKIFDIIKTKQIACYLAFILSLGITNKSVSL